ncbi:TPA: hypothetical protein HA251_05905 [Candidatus Woesearchaeota archaeon]|nr:hypothetical protein [Candidatus Woesearchaeota archaeon]
MSIRLPTVKEQNFFVAECLYPVLAFGDVKAAKAGWNQLKAAKSDYDLLSPGWQEFVRYENAHAAVRQLRSMVKDGASQGDSLESSVATPVKAAPENPAVAYARRQQMKRVYVNSMRDLYKARVERHTGFKDTCY